MKLLDFHTNIHIKQFTPNLFKVNVKYLFIEDRRLFKIDTVNTDDAARSAEI